jgi:Fe2+ transport system protein FeoA
MSGVSIRELEAECLVNLNQAGVGCDFQIRLLAGPNCERLRSLGFCESMRVRKLIGGRNLLCTVCGARMALSSKLAQDILVEPAE